MNNLIVFNYQNNQVRTVQKDGEPWFVLKDVCEILDIKNPTQAAERLEADERTMFDIGRQGKVNIINESGLYSLILRSDKQEAKPFRKWVTSEVLPSIRKTGAYNVRKPADDIEAKAKYNNSRARISSLWLRLADKVGLPEYQQICAHYAAKELAGEEVLPLPATSERYYSATEVGKMLGVSSKAIGTIANKNGLKNDQYGKLFYDKSPYSEKEVQSFRYNEAAIEQLKKLVN